MGDIEGRETVTAGGVDEMGDPYSERSVVLCRTCMRPLTWETRTEPGYKPRTGWYDDARSDPLVCFKAVDYRHVPLTAREWAYYEAGQRSAHLAQTAPEQPDAVTAALDKVIHRLLHDIPVTADGYASVEELEEVVREVRAAHTAEVRDA